MPDPTRDPILVEKVTQVAAILREKQIDAWLIFVRESGTTPDPSLDLLLGTRVTWQSAFVLTAGGERIALVGSLDAANIESTGLYPEVMRYVTGVSAPLRQLLARLDPQRIAINTSKNDVMSDGLTHGMYEILLEALAGTPYADRLVSSQPLVAALRGRKTPAELARIRAACDVTEEIFVRLTPRLRPGMTEREVAALIVAEIAAAGVEPAWDPSDCPAVFTGPESAGAHAGPTDRVIEPGHVMNVDFGVRKDGYCSDLQRTWYFLRPGETAPPPAVAAGLRTIVAAIAAAAASLRPGVQGWEVDAVARGLITSAGYPEYQHALGHQIGRQAHDGAGLLCPRWERYGTIPDERVEAGQCYTLEPRLPIAGHGVATLEEIVIVRPDGPCEFLSRRQQDLLLVPPLA